MGLPIGELPLLEWKRDCALGAAYWEAAHLRWRARLRIGGCLLGSCPLWMESETAHWGWPVGKRPLGEVGEDAALGVEVRKLANWAGRLSW